MTLTIELDDATRAVLERLAAERGCTVEELAREAVASLTRRAVPTEGVTSPNFSRFRAGNVAGRSEELLREAAREGRWP